MPNLDYDLETCPLDQIKFEELSPDELIQVFYRVYSKIPDMPEEFIAPLHLIALSAASCKETGEGFLEDVQNTAKQADAVIQAYITYIKGDKEKGIEQLNVAVKVMGYDSPVDIMFLLDEAEKLVKEAEEDAAALTLKDTTKDLIDKHTRRIVGDAKKSTKRDRN